LLKRSRVKSAERILDANINRAKEGLRVCEEVARFIINSRPLTAAFKNLRHGIDSALLYLPSRKKIIMHRDAGCDIGKEILGNELTRNNIADIFMANLQRAKESVRVLEEFSKLYAKKPALLFKAIRYRIYTLEKKVLKDESIRLR
jgi:thiamine-phosphate pyrophosphorylase